MVAKSEAIQIACDVCQLEYACILIDIGILIEREKDQQHYKLLAIISSE